MTGTTKKTGQLEQQPAKGELKEVGLERQGAASQVILIIKGTKWPTWMASGIAKITKASEAGEWMSGLVNGNGAVQSLVSLKVAWFHIGKRGRPAGLI
ncbi:MAG: hypothetical protein LH609_02885 [Rudanella sp.]|nr:hypothetical protein [Rudanella sp.]